MNRQRGKKNSSFAHSMRKYDLFQLGLPSFNDKGKDSLTTNLGLASTCIILVIILLYALVKFFDIGSD